MSEGSVASAGTASAVGRAALAGDARSEVLHRSARTLIRRVWPADGSPSVICKELSGSGSVDRARHEADMLRRLDGVPGVVRLVGTPRPDVLVLADDGGSSLARTIAGARSTPGGRPALPEVLALGARLAATLSQVHARGVVHRDVNPANVVLAGDATPLLIDFDLAGAVAEGRTALDHRGEIVGTLQYLPPEQTGRTARPVDGRADLYGLGALLHELLAGRPPFEGDDDLRLIHDILLTVPSPLQDLVPGLPGMVGDLVARLLQKEPDLRYRSADGLARDLSTLARDPDGPITLGRWDFPARLAPPSRLVGREAETAALHAAFVAALAGSGRAVLITGRPGVGKSALLHELEPLVAARGGWRVTAKFEQFRHDSTLGGAVEAVRDVARLLLGQPEAALTALRADLAVALDLNAGLLAGAIPEYGMLLGLPPDPAEHDPARLPQAVVDALRVVVTPDRPVVLVLDDLQWADPASLAVMDALLTRHPPRGLLVVGTFRSGLDPAHPLPALLARWQRLGVAAPALALDDLALVHTGLLVSEMLHEAPSAVVPLAAALHERAGGNPFDTVELVNSLRGEGALTLTDEGWRWDLARVRRHVGRGDVVDLLRERIARLPAPTRELLTAMACLGSDLTIGLLAAATELDAATVRSRLAPALEDDLLVSASGVGRQLVPLDGSPDDRVAFRHDRVLQATITGTGGDADRVRLRRDLARALDRSGYGGEAAEQYLAVQDACPGWAADPRTSRQERGRAVRLYATAARAARRSANYATAERLLSAAAAVMASPGGTGTDVSPVELGIERHAALHALGRLDEADVQFADLRSSGADAVALARVGGVQVSSLSQRGLQREAMALGLELLAGLGMHPPGDGEALPLPQRLAEVADWAASLDVAVDLARPAVVDPRALAIEQLFNRLLPTAFFLGDKPAVAWIVLESRRLWAEHGPSGGLAAVLSCVGLVAMPVTGDHELGYVVSRHVLAVAEARGFEPDTSVLRHRHALHALHWREPLENAIGQAQQAHEGLVRGGDLQMAGNTAHPLLAASLDTNRSLEAHADEVEAALRFTDRTGNPHTALTVLPHRLLVRELTGRTAAPAGTDGTDGTEARLATVDSHPMAAGILAVTRSVVAAVLGDVDALAASTASAVALAGFVPGYPVVLARALRAVSLAERLGRPDAADERASLRAELDVSRGWLVARAAHAPANVAHLLAWVDAEQAAAVGEPLAALAAFDVAVRASQGLQRPWHRAVVTERAGRWHRRLGLAWSGDRLLAAARQAFDAWGASVKVTALDREFPHLTGEDAAGPAVGRLTLAGRERRNGPGGSSVVRGQDLDLMVILRASQEISSQTTLEGLHTAVVEQLATLTGATDVLVAVLADDDGPWVLPSHEPGGAPVPLEEAGAAGRAPLSAFRYVQRTGEVLLADDAARDNRLHPDPFLAGRERCSLLAVPLRHQGTLRAVLVLVGSGVGAFTADRLDAVHLVAGQLMVTLRNALLYRLLESKVAERTHALEAANQQLEILSVTDALTGLTNRRALTRVLAAEWHRAGRQGTALGVLMIDVDHFKAFNDRYGHPAGDDCLRRVSAALRDSTRDGLDVTCRYGGEEFAVVLPGGTQTVLQIVADRIRSAVAALGVEHAGAPQGMVTVSIGGASALPPAAGPDPTAGSVPDTADATVARADAALYEAKRAGRDRFRLAPPSP